MWKFIEGVEPLISEPKAKKTKVNEDFIPKTTKNEWYIGEVNPQLRRYLTHLTAPFLEAPMGSQRKLKFFLPLCGKSKDILYLVKLGYDVFCVECLPSIIHEFMSECHLSLKYDPSRQLYHNRDETLKIFCGDLFNCPIEKYGPFDCIWDYASFILFYYPLRPGYLEMIKRAVAYQPEFPHNFRYLLQTVKYDKTKPIGPPYSVDDQDMSQFFEGWAKVTKLESTRTFHYHPMRRAANYIGPDFYEEFYLIEPKV